MKEVPPTISVDNTVLSYNVLHSLVTVGGLVTVFLMELKTEQSVYFVADGLRAELV